ncbi:MAG: hypothetical protein M3N14_03410 [Bacteroidota bacterium]|nr:hypothetical protein [Bacteroidota bacterium]
MDDFNIPDFCFFFPYLEDSGVPVLFYRLANTIAKTYPNVHVSVIDYQNGAMARHLLELPNLKLYVFNDGVAIVPPENAILVTQSIVPYYWPKELQPSNKTRLFYWNLHPQNFVPSLIPFANLRDVTINHFFIHKFFSYFFPGVINQIRQYVLLLLNHKALSFMDDTNLNTTKRYLFLKNFPVQYLPVPGASEITERKRINRQDNNSFNFCWIGRLCDFKVYILVYTAGKLSELARQMNVQITYYVIGDGPLKLYVEEQLTENSNFKVEILGAMPHEKLDKFLLEKIDVVTAMGTSALEGAKLGIPTIVLDASYQPIKGDYCFRFLYQTQNYDLAHFITKKDYKPKNKSLEKIFTSIISNYDREAERSYQYYLSNHSIEEVIKKFIFQTNSSTLEFGMIDKRLFEETRLLKLLNRIRNI